MSSRLFTILLFALAAFISVNAVWLKSSAAGLILGALYLVSGGLYLERKINGAGWLIRTAAGLLLWLAILTTISGVVYIFWNLKALAVILIIILSPLLLFVIDKIIIQPAPPPAQNDDLTSITHGIQKKSFFIITAVISLLLLAFAFFSVLLMYRTGAALRSPWNTVPNIIFPLFFVISLLAIAIIVKHSNGKNIVWLWFIAVVMTMMTLSVGIIVYGVGYGFDPFVHRAAEKLIQINGIVEPKQWYYAGQYGLVTIIAAIFQINAAIIDKLLLPAIASLALPTILFFSFRRQTENWRAIFLTILIALSLPLAWFISTTPQGLANLVLLAVIFIYFANSQTLSEGSFGARSNTRILIWSLAAASIVIHPLAGLPAAMLVIISQIPLAPTRRWLILTSSASLGLVLILPLLFSIKERALSSALPTFIADIAEGQPPLFSGWLYWEQRYNLVLDAVYYYGFNIPIIILILAAIGIIIRYRAGLGQYDAPLLAAAAITAVDGFLLNRFFAFQFLIDYERTAYGDRLLEMSAFFLLPFAALSILKFCEKLISPVRNSRGVWRSLRELSLAGIRAPQGGTGRGIISNGLKASPLLLLFWGLTMASFKTAGFYLTYPRFDTYAYDRGYSPSTSDLKAVRIIENEADGPYIVLANQAASAAALQELGFKQYFSRRDKASQEQVFFYAIPTGGSLYQYYLKMVYDSPSKKTMGEAMDLVGVKEGYFILNDYWSDSKKIAEAAKLEADEWKTVDEDKIYIFKYRQSPSP